MSYPDGSSCSLIEQYRGYNILSCGPGTFPYDAQGVITYTIPDLYGDYSFFATIERAHEVIDEALEPRLPVVPIVLGLGAVLLLFRKK